MNESDTNKLGKTSLIGLVIGSMIGGGAFNIISDMGGQAGGLAIMIGWIITAIGMISLAFVFQNLTNVRPDLEGVNLQLAHRLDLVTLLVLKCLGLLVCCVSR